MSVFSTRPALRWVVPGAALAAVVAGVGVTNAVSAGADTHLAPVTARTLLVDLQQARPQPLSGTVRQSADLGLPALPQQGQGPSAGLATSLLSGTHTWRVWSDGPDRSRLALLQQGSEYDLVHHGSTNWLWSSADHTATRLHSPASGGSEDHRATGSSEPKTSGQAPDLSTPQQAADWALAQLRPSTQVSTTSNTVVAGRPAYTLELTPRGGDSLVESVRLAVDSRTHLPLRVQVYSTRTHAPAIDVGFSSIRYERPDPSVFDFTPPPGATVTDQQHPSTHGGTATPDEHTHPSPPQRHGSGWATVWTGTVPAQLLQSHGSGSADPQAMLRMLPRVSGSWGSGRLLESTLFTAVLTDDGRYAVGAVPASALYAALG